MLKNTNLYELAQSELAKSDRKFSLKLEKMHKKRRKKRFFPFLTTFPGARCENDLVNRFFSYFLPYTCAQNNFFCKTRISASNCSPPFKKKFYKLFQVSNQFGPLIFRSTNPAVVILST